MYKVNIVVPSLTTDSHLVRCLNGVQNLNYKNFFVTLVLDDSKNLSMIKKFKFNMKILFLKKAHMSKKRNIAAKKFKSDMGLLKIQVIQSEKYCMVLVYCP